MMPLDLTHCRHCLIEGHWIENCPLLIPAESLKQHLKRIDEIRDRFLYENLSPLDRTRMIKHENALWKDRQAAAKSA